MSDLPSRDKAAAYASVFDTLNDLSDQERKFWLDFPSLWLLAVEQLARVGRAYAQGRLVEVADDAPVIEVTEDYAIDLWEGSERIVPPGLWQIVLLPVEVPDEDA